MNAALLFCLARKTARCEREIRRFSGYFSLPVTQTELCVQESGLRLAMARLMRGHSAVFLVGSCPGARPACADALFSLLHIPPDKTGEPRGVLRFSALGKTGYLVESLNQAIAVLPDEPEALREMLPPALERLKEKFALEGAVPVPETPDYEALMEESLRRPAERSH